MGYFSEVANESMLDDVIELVYVDLALVPIAIGRKTSWSLISEF
jgi:hypothetical protein